MNHTPFNQKIKSFHEQTKAYTCLPDMAQRISFWKDYDENPHKCCFGARIAKALRISYCARVGTYCFSDGRESMLKALGFESHLDGIVYSESHLSALMWLCGTPCNPFDETVWIHSPQSVMDRLCQVEHSLTKDEVLEITDIWHQESMHVEKRQDTFHHIWTRITSLDHHPVAI